MDVGIAPEARDLEPLFLEEIDGPAGAGRAAGVQKQFFSHRLNYRGPTPHRNIPDGLRIIRSVRDPAQGRK
jgi:hypothetical protein